MSEIKVVVKQYDDRGDPAGPNNWRVELLFAGSIWVKAYSQFSNEQDAKREAAKLEHMLKDLVA